MAMPMITALPSLAYRIRALERNVKAIHSAAKEAAKVLLANAGVEIGARTISAKPQRSLRKRAASTSEK